MNRKRISKDVILALLILLLLVIFAVTNGLISASALNELTATVTDIEISGEQEDTLKRAHMLAEKFDVWSFFFSITVNHNDIGEAESELIELVEAIEANDTTAARIAKSRLLGALEELRRLSGFGLDSII